MFQRLAVARLLQEWLELFCFLPNSVGASAGHDVETEVRHDLEKTSEVALRVIIAIWALAGMGIASLSFGGAGFPDGYISPYDRLTLVPQTLLSFILLLAGIFLLTRSAINRTSRLDILLGMAMLPCLYLPMTVMEHCPRWQMCTALFERTTGVMMDDGAGG